MTPREVGLLLTKAGTIDKRIVDEVSVTAWKELIGDLALAVAMDALDHHRRNHPGVYFEPGHVTAYTKSMGGTNAQAPYNRSVRQALTDGTVANCNHGYATPERDCGICRRRNEPMRLKGAA